MSVHPSNDVAVQPDGLIHYVVMNDDVQLFGNCSVWYGSMALLYACTAARRCSDWRPKQCLRMLYWSFSFVLSL